MTKELTRGIAILPLISWKLVMEVIKDCRLMKEDTQYWRSNQKLKGFLELGNEALTWGHWCLCWGRVRRDLWFETRLSFKTPNSGERHLPSDGWCAHFTHGKTFSLAGVPYFMDLPFFTFLYSRNFILFSN